MKNIYLLGCTGSIGIQTLEVIDSLGGYNIKAMSFGKRIEVAIPLIEKYQPDYVCAELEKDANNLKKMFPKIEVGYGDAGLIKAATFNQGDDGVLINALVGLVGLAPTIAAIKINRKILLANKETLVVGGELIESLEKEYKVDILPIDSEHSAILQCIRSGSKKEISELIITASGGAFRDKTRSELDNVTIEDALNHPNWSMGKKITVDCATMVNKGLEVMEAHYLFKIPYEKISCIIHKESIIHSMVKFNDGSIIGEMAKADMRIPIQYALTYPNKLEFKLDKSLDLNDISHLSFEKMSFARYPMLALAYEVAKMKGIMPLVYNSSNEEAVRLFLDNKIKFLDIEKIIIASIDYFKKENKALNNLEDILKYDKIVRNYVCDNYQLIIR